MSVSGAGGSMKSKCTCQSRPAEVMLSSSETTDVFTGSQMFASETDCNHVTDVTIETM